MNQYKSSVITSSNDESENVRVAVRVRPLNKKELREGLDNIASIDKENKVISLAKPGLPDEATKSFRFDYIFPEDCTQMDLYKHIAHPIVEKVFQGCNGTIFAYGQTGTGKTYTMIGEQNNTEQKGIIPNTFHHIFDEISSCDSKKSAVVTVSYLEIYNEDVRDLLSSNPNAKLEVRERLDIGIYVKDLVGFTVNSIQEMIELMDRGNANRFTRSTLMNDISSRSHAIFTMTIEHKNKANNQTTVAKLNLVDLAGSERLGRTNATGDRLKEASNINQSLSVLGIVISALVNGKSSHIPYRNSKLTRLLQDSLGGNSMTTMIAMISPSESDYEESVCTLRYASRAKHVRNQIKVNIKTEKNKYLEQEMTQLMMLIMSLQEENTALVLERNKDKEQLEAFYEDHRRQDEEHQRAENMVKDNFDEVKLKRDFISADEDEEDFEGKHIEDDAAEMEPATKRFCEFLIKQTPENSFSSLLKTYAKQKLSSEYALRNYRLYNMTLNRIKSPRMPERSTSTPNLSQIEQVETVRKCKSSSCINEDIPSELLEINSIRLTLEKLQSILTRDSRKSDQDEEMESQNESVCKRYAETIDDLKRNLQEASENQAKLEETNRQLEIELRNSKNELVQVSDCQKSLESDRNSAQARTESLEKDNRSLKEQIASLENRLDYYKNIEATSNERNKDLQENLAKFTNQLETLNDELIQYQCEGDILKQKERNLLESITNKDEEIRRLKDGLAKESKNVKVKEMQVQSIMEDMKKIENKLTLSTVRVTYLEKNMDDIRNENNRLSVSNKNYEKKIEEYRKETSKLTTVQAEFKRQASQQERRLGNLMLQNENLTSQNNSLSIDFEKATKNLEGEIAIRNELDQKLKVKEQAIKAQQFQVIRLKQNLQVGKNQWATMQDLQNKISRLITENNNLQDTVRMYDLQNKNPAHKIGVNQDTSKLTIEFRNAINSLGHNDISGKIKLRKAEQIVELLHEREKEIASLKVQLSEANAKIQSKDEDKRISANGIAGLGKENGDLMVTREKYEELKCIAQRRYAKITELKTRLETQMKMPGQITEVLHERAKEVVSLKAQLSEANAKIEKIQTELESTKNACECKIKAVRTSLSNKRRLEKNILHDSRRNICNEDANERTPTKNDVEHKDKRICPDENVDTGEDGASMVPTYELSKSITQQKPSKITELEKRLDRQTKMAGNIRLQLNMSDHNTVNLLGQ